MSSVERYQAGGPRALQVGRRQVPLPVLRVVGTSAAVGAGAAWTGTAVVLVLTQLAVVAGWAMIVGPLVLAALVFGRAAVVEMGARDQLRKRDRRAAARAVLWADEHGVEELPVVEASPAGPVYAHASRQQQALPPVERRLPPTTRLELGR